MRKNRCVHPPCLARLRYSLLAFALLSCVAGAAGGQEVNPAVGRVDGRIQDANGVAIAGAEVLFLAKDAAEAGSDPIPAAVAADGTFTVTLPVGTYVLTVVLDGYLPHTESIRVSTEPLTLEISLALAGFLAEVDVTGSYEFNRSDPISTVSLSTEDLATLPRLSNDIYRTLPMVPGVSGNDVSAQFSVRGGLFQDTGQYLDRVEIFEPYHLKDFQGVFSIVDPEILGGVNLTPGGFSAEKGDRLAGMLDLTTVDPGTRKRLTVGISLTNVYASGAGSGERSGWLWSARRGYLDLLLSLVGEEEEDGETREGDGPAYWDVFGGYDWALTDKQNLGFRILASGDSNEEIESENDDYGDPENEATNSKYGNGYLWANHDAVINDRTLVTSTASVGRVTRDRKYDESGFQLEARIRDERDSTVIDLKQDWSLMLTDRNVLTAGFGYRSYDTDYDYLKDLDNVIVDDLFVFDESFRENHISAYVSDRMQLFDSLVLELGVRYDSQSFSSDDQVSPRVNLVYAPADLGQFRFAWGHYYQSQRPWELQVQDGDTNIYPAEKAVYAQLGWEQRFSGGYGLRFDAYQRTIDPVNPRYDNLFTGFSLNPEIERDRVRLEPERSDAHGLELSFNRRGMRRFDWWINYAYSVIEDRIDGRDVPRSYDQTHAVTAILDWRLGEKWNLNLAWNYHTGWPTTPVGAEVVEIDGEPTIQPIIGPPYSERLDDYHRLDMRLSRRTTWKNGQTFEVYLDIQNLYNRENEAGFYFDERSFELLPDGSILIDPVAESWLGIFPSFGVTWSF